MSHSPSVPFGIGHLLPWTLGLELSAQLLLGWLLASFYSLNSLLFAALTVLANVIGPVVLIASILVFLAIVGVVVHATVAMVSATDGVVEATAAFVVLRPCALRHDEGFSGSSDLFDVVCFADVEILGECVEGLLRSCRSWALRLYGRGFATLKIGVFKEGLLLSREK